MIFKIDFGTKHLQPIPFAGLDGLEKDLENILAQNLPRQLLGEHPQLVFHQELPFEARPDILALDRRGNVIIYELKLGTAGSDAVSQLLRYVEGISKWTLPRLEEMYIEYIKNHPDDMPVWLASVEIEELKLPEVHQRHFGLDAQVKTECFNKFQKMYVVGNSADSDLILSVDYWKSKGIDIDFIPYRVFKIGSDSYLEFFSKPYDQHPNPRDVRGVIWDTGGRHLGIRGLQHAFETKRAFIWGDLEYMPEMKKGDYVFHYHIGVGIVSAARVVGGLAHGDDWEENERYYNVDFLTKTPDKISDQTIEQIPHLTKSELEEFFYKSFFFANTFKRPYLYGNEPELLAKKLLEKIGAP